MLITELVPQIVLFSELCKHDFLLMFRIVHNGTFTLHGKGTGTMSMGLVPVTVLVPVHPLFLVLLPLPCSVNVP